MKTKAEEIQRNLSQFIGSVVLYQMPYFQFKYTEGVKYVAEACEAYWLLTDSGIECMNLSKDEGLIVVKLVRNDDDSAQLIYEDGNYNNLKTVEISYTDFPLKEIKFYFIDGIMLLPTEY